MKKLLTLLAIFVFSQNIEAQNLIQRDVANYQVDLSDVWGWSDGEKEYALVGLLNAFTVVDVTDPDNIVKLFQATVSGPNTYWRDIKTYSHYAYGVHDGPFSGQSQGLVIMDLQYLPDSMPATFYTAGGQLTESHNIWIDENGIAYLAGHDYGGSGVLMLDIATDPLNPSIVGQYSNGYVHDCFTRNDTLWTSDGNASAGGAGQKRFSIVDVSDKSNPVLLGTGATPGGYSHNIWPSDDGRSVFTTDESGGAFVAAHDITDMTDIAELDRYRSSPSSNVIPHNVTVLEDFLIISYYRDGIVVLDATLPDKLVRVGRFDTAPLLSGYGFNGSWGVYPYLPSGNILAADIETGLHVLTPDYKRAIHIRGTVSDAASQQPITGAGVEITFLGDTTGLTTDLDGNFREGYPDAGIYAISVTKAGYTPYTETRALDNGDILDLDIELSTGNYLGNFAWIDSNEDGIQDPGEPGLENVEVRLLNDSGTEVSSDLTDQNGAYGFLDIAAGSYYLEFRPPANGVTRYIATRPDVASDELDSDISKIDNRYRTTVFALPGTGSFLDVDGGFFPRPQTDPVDTIIVSVGFGQTVVICDEGPENGLVMADMSVLCGSSGDPGGSAFNTDTPGCLDFQAGSSDAGPIEICLITNDASTSASDTTIYVVTVSDVLSAVENVFDGGGLELLQNPVTSFIYLRNALTSDLIGEGLHLMVSDLSGREILNRKDYGFNRMISLRVGNLTPGMYVLTVYSDRGLIGVSRIVKR